MMQYIKVDKNPLFGSSDKVHTCCFWSKFDIQSAVRSPKSNHFFPPSHYCVCASLVKIHPLVQKIECRQKAMRMPTGSTPKAICPPPPHCRSVVGHIKSFSFIPRISCEELIFNIFPNYILTHLTYRANGKKNRVLFCNNLVNKLCFILQQFTGGWGEA